MLILSTASMHVCCTCRLHFDTKCDKPFFFLLVHNNSIVQFYELISIFAFSYMYILWLYSWYIVVETVDSETAKKPMKIHVILS